MILKLLPFVLAIALCTKCAGNTHPENADLEPKSTGQPLALNNTLQVESETAVRNVALSFHQWSVASFLNDSTSIVTDFEVVKSPNGKCELDSAGYFKNLRMLGTISEKFIQMEWKRVMDCSAFLKKITWKRYNSSEAYEYQDYCDFYYHYWTRTQEPYHGVEVKNMEHVDDHYVVTLHFYHDYGNKEYSTYSFPVVKVEQENVSWKITQITWLEG